MNADPRRGGLATPEEWLARQEALAEFGMHALRTEDLYALLDDAAMHAAHGLGVEFAKVVKIVPGSGKLLICAGYGWEEGWLGTMLDAAGDRSAAGHALETGKPVISDDVNIDPRFDEAEITKAHDIHSAVNVIIKGDGPAYGVLECDSRELRRFSPQDISFLQTFAALVALAIERNTLTARNALLLAEVHHRVKNGLQQVASLLSLQATTADAAVRQQLAAANQRVMAVAHIHERLYETEDMASVELGRYLHDFAQSVPHISASGARVDVVVDADEVDVTSNQAVTFALLANELLTNALRHAFPKDARGRVRLMLKASDGQLRLEVTDDGTGLPSDFDCAKGKGLGTRIITALVEQLRGTVDCNPGERGARFTITVPIQPIRKYRMVVS